MKFKIIFFLSWFLLFSLSPLTSAQELDPTLVQQIDTHILQVMDEIGVPGVAIAIVQGDEIVYLQGHGVADDAGRPMTAQTPALLASVSKSFTGLAVMQLIEAGALDFATPVTDILDWFPYEDITIAHLLYHTSGFDEVSDNAYLIAGSLEADALDTTMRRVVVENPPVDAPDTGFRYMNINYDLLALVVQTVSGQLYEDYVVENIFNPLEMNNSYTNLEAAQANGMTQGYSPFFGTMQARAPVYTRGFIGSAGIIASAEDIAHYQIAMLNGGQYGDSSVLSAESVGVLHTPGHIENRYFGYAMGLRRWPLWQANQDIDLYTVSIPYYIGHDGEMNVTRTFQFLLPDLRYGIVVMANASDVHRSSYYDNFPAGIMQILYGISVDELEISAANEDYFQQNAISLLSIVVAVWLVIGLVTIVHIWRLWRKSPMRSRWIVVILLILALADICLIYWMFSVPNQYDTTHAILFAFSPDIQILFYVLMIIAAGWGIIRTFLYVWALRRGNG